MWRMLVSVLCCAALGCYTRDNPADPGRCWPACTGGEICWNGRCQPPTDGPIDSGAGDVDTGDAGGVDGEADAVVPSGPPIVYSSRSGTELSTYSDTWTDIEDLAPLTVSSSGSDYLFILNAPDTWASSNGDGTDFGIVVDDVMLASGGYYHPAGSQRSPMTVVAAKRLAAGEHTVKAQWQRSGMSYVHLGAQNATWLVAVRADRGIHFATRNPIGVSVDVDTWTDLLDLGTVTVSTSGDYLLILNAPGTWTEAADVAGMAQFRIIVDDEQVAGGLYTAAEIREFMLMTVVGVKNLTAGDHSIKAQWRGPGGGTKIHLEFYEPWLIALPWAKPIVHGSGSPGELSTTSTDWENIDIAPLSLESTGGDHLFILNAVDTWADAASTLAASFQTLVDGATVGSGIYGTGIAGQRVPITIVGVQDLASGQHSIAAQFKASGTVHLGSTYQTVLVGLGP